MSKLKYKKADNLIQRFLGFLDHHSVFWMQLPFILLFVVFIIIPILIAIVLSFTDFNSIEFPNFVGLDNYVNILTNDTIFMENALPNTIQFAVIVGFGGYFLSFFLAWTLAQVTPIPRTIMAVILYLPSMTGGIMLSTVWQVIFAGDKIGYLNSFLLKLDFIQKPILWLSDGKYLMTIMILVTLWSSMGIGFLAMLSGILNINPELYEANGSIGVMLSGANPTPGYAGQLLVTHAEEHAFIRYEMGYGAAVSVLILLLVWGISQISKRLFAEKD
ncbi:MAG: transporter permease [Anaerocolumna sp.]|nr:transporter permease [Anaerocolumna sp.]